MGFLHFIRLWKFLYVPTLLMAFLMNGCWILSVDFSVSMEMIGHLFPARTLTDEKCSL